MTQLRHLLSVRDLDRDAAVGILDLAEDMADVATASRAEAADPAGQDGGQPVLRGLDPHPPQLRGGGQAARRRRDHVQRQGLERVEGRVTEGHRRRPSRRWASTPSSSGTTPAAPPGCSPTAAGSTRPSSTRATAPTSTRRRRCSTRTRCAKPCTATARGAPTSRGSGSRSWATSCTRGSRDRMSGC